MHLIHYMGEKSSLSKYETTKKLKPYSGARDMVQWLRVLAALPKDLSSVPRTYIAALPGGPKISSGLCKHQAYMWFIDIHEGKTSI